MAPDLKQRNFLKLLDFTPEEIRYLLDLAAQLKIEKNAGTEQARLRGKNIALIFEKASTRTRCAFEVAAYDQGANVTYLGPTGSQIGVKESMKDTARVLARMYDGIEYRGFGQETAEELGRHGVPVWKEDAIRSRDEPGAAHPAEPAARQGAYRQVPQHCATDRGAAKGYRRPVGCAGGGRLCLYRCLGLDGRARGSLG